MRIFLDSKLLRVQLERQTLSLSCTMLESKILKFDGARNFCRPRYIEIQHIFIALWSHLTLKMGGCDWTKVASTIQIKNLWLLKSSALNAKKYNYSYLPNKRAAPNECASGNFSLTIEYKGNKIEAISGSKHWLESKTLSSFKTWWKNWTFSYAFWTFIVHFWLKNLKNK